jgi:RNA polymerase sigma factor (sigma-70 family)
MSDVIRDSNIGDITGLSVDISALTFRQFKALLPGTEGQKLPTVKALRESDIRVLAIVETKDGVLTVFCNGFFMYETKSGHATVYAVDRCANIVLSPVKDGTLNALDENTLDDCPWPKVLEFAANERIVSNANRDVERQEVLSLDAVDEDRDMRLMIHPEFETRLEEEESLMEESEKLRAALAKLTNRQREIIRLYYFDGMTQENIASRLEISQQATSKALKQAYQKIKDVFSALGKNT